MPGDDKTEKATPKKRRDAREKEGKVLQSKEIVTAVSILGTFAALAALGSYMFISLTRVVESRISAVGDEFVNDISSYTGIFLGVIKDSVLIVPPLCAIISFIVIAISIIIIIIIIIVIIIVISSIIIIVIAIRIFLN